jgi:hypothetical protein
MAAPDNNPMIRAILDRSALESYARGHVHVGELLREIADEQGACVGIPAVALLEAHGRSIGDEQAQALLNFMVTLPTATVLPLNREVVETVARYVPVVDGDLARAHALWAARTHEALCFTTEPEAFPAAILPEQIVAIPAEDA